MKTLKYILFGFLGLVALIYIVALIAPKEFETKRDIVINLPRQEVFDYIKYIKNQDNFGVWQLAEPDLKKTYEGVDGTVGFKYSWEGKNTGTQTVTRIVEGERLETELDFGFGDPAKSFLITEDAGENQTKVTWGISGRTPVPFNLMSLFYDMGGDFEGGLENLKRVLEN